MNKLYILLLTACCLLVLGTSTFAAEPIRMVYVDYSQQKTATDIEVDFVTIGGDYLNGHLMLGGLYETAIKTNPLDSLDSIDYLQAYGGYNILESDTAVLGIIGAWGSLTSEEYPVEGGPPTETDITSLMIGIRGELHREAFSLSLTYLYGLNNTLKLNGAKVADIDISYLELKAGCDFTDSLGVYLAYREYSVENQILSGGFSGLGLGLQYRF